MKRIIRHYAVDTFSLFTVSQIASGMVFEKGIQTLLLAGVGVMLVSLLIRPIINILLLPLNLVTFGLFRWVSSAIVIFLVTLVVPGFKLTGFHFPGLTTAWFDLPALNFSGIMAYIAFSFVLSLMISVIYWIID